MYSNFDQPKRIVIGQTLENGQQGAVISSTDMFDQLSLVSDVESYKEQLLYIYRTKT